MLSRRRLPPPVRRSAFRLRHSTTKLIPTQGINHRVKVLPTVTHFARSTIKRAREHLLYFLRSQKAVCFSRFPRGSDEPLVRADAVDVAWFWPQSLIHQAASQLERAGIVAITLPADVSPANTHAFELTLTAKGEKFLRSGKAFRCRTDQRRPRATFSTTNQTTMSEPSPRSAVRPRAGGRVGSVMNRLSIRIDSERKS